LGEINGKTDCEGVLGGRQSHLERQNGLEGEKKKKKKKNTKKEKKK